MNICDTSSLNDLAFTLSAQFGPYLEICYHNVRDGKITGSSKLVSYTTAKEMPVPYKTPQQLRDLLAEGPDAVEEYRGTILRNDDGSLFKVSMICNRDEATGTLKGILEIRNDLTLLNSVHDTVSIMLGKNSTETAKSTVSSMHVNHLLEDYISESIRRVGKPVVLMNRTDKINAVRYLYETGALLISKSGSRICECFGISKFTLYSYLDEIKAQDIDETAGASQPDEQEP